MAIKIDGVIVANKNVKKVLAQKNKNNDKSKTKSFVWKKCWWIEKTTLNLYEWIIKEEYADTYVINGQCRTLTKQHLKWLMTTSKWIIQIW